MAPTTNGRTRPPKPKKEERSNKRKRDDVDASQLDEAVSALDTKATFTSFSDLPFSAPTVAGLKAAHFTTLTDVQAKAIPLALKGCDVLGAAKTGLGAMIISPTRELAIQIFEVLRTVGRKGHLFAAGLVIGGKSLREERDALARMNIVVCTPGRILQHLSQTAAFNVDNLRMLVLDEADRILDMGFKKDVDAIIEYLPPDRQTLLFSATQTKRVSDLARLSLREPEYISVHEAASSATPQTLQQNYTLTPLPLKLDTLWSFLQSSKKSKILVFLSSGKQVRFVYEAFRHMQPGIPLLHLHGRQKQIARLDITSRFSRAKASCLFATDVVARGLDFPAVDWVVQVDCPEDADTYIHRVGRTARYERVGRAVLFLDPSEEAGMLARFEQKRVPIEKINVRERKQHSIREQLQSMCFQDPALKYLGQKAFASYVRSLHVQKDKEVFKLGEYDLEGFASSLGLPGTPRIKFLKADADAVKERKNAPRLALEAGDSESDGDVDETGAAKPAKKEVRTKYDRMFERKNQDVLAEHYSKMTRDDGEAEVDLNRLDGEQADDNDDDLFDIKRRIPADSDSGSEDLEPISEPHTITAETTNPSGAKTILIPGAREPLILDSKRREKLLLSKKKLLKLKDKGSKLVFDDDGTAHAVYELEDEAAFRARGAAESQRQAFVEAEGKKVAETDVLDKGVAREKKRAKREKRKERERAEEEREGAEVEGGEDAMANFLADAGSGSEEEERNGERQMKWFENDKAQERVEREEGEVEIETFDDLEAEAARLLG